MIPRRWRARAALAAVFAAAWLGYARIWPDAPFMVSDSASYVEAAADLADGHLDALHDRTPGYPALLALVGAGHGPNRFLFHVQMLLHCTALAFGVWLLRQCGLSARWIAPFVLIGLAPANVAPAAQVLTETLTGFLLVSAVASAIAWLRGGRRHWLAACAAAIAAAGWVRPVYLPAGIAVAAVLSVAARCAPAARRGNGAALAFAGGSLVATAAIVGYNAVHFQFPGATPLLGFNLCTRTVRFLERLPDEYAAVREILVQARDRDLTMSGGQHLGTMYIWNTRAALRAATGLDDAQLSSFMLRLNGMLIRRAPLEYAGEVARAAGTFWFPWVPEAAVFGSRGALLASSAVQAVYLVCYLVFTIMIASVALVAWRIPAVRRPLADALPAPAGTMLGIMALVFCLALFTMLVSCSIESGAPRYRMPLDLLLALAALLGWRVWVYAVPRRAPRLVPGQMQGESQAR